MRIEVGSLQNRAELCAIFFSSPCSVTSSTVFELPSNSPTALWIFLHRSLAHSAQEMNDICTSVQIFQFLIIACVMDRVYRIVLPQNY